MAALQRSEVRFDVKIEGLTGRRINECGRR